ncbi:hypothetical protein DM860_008352 [Cuscuta australis]|uniref:Bifunctional inhibitor/plant lipid transfer protein/seed storage helical domain-containing protein n=1 Tax=Cuscuta australis TaxID=267555 RepID=A0A328D309_9ASTE|nr:hypothetical protein DM860_008352 [Cuscuta australis]
MKNSYTSPIVLCAMFVVAMLMATTGVAEPAAATATVAVAAATNSNTCNPSKLSPCAAAMTSPKLGPTRMCCRELKQQKNCLCQYKHNPNLKKYFTSLNAHKVATACKISPPRCS